MHPKARPLPPVQAPPGGYAVDDPDQPGRLTTWTVDADGKLHRYPPNQRQEPLPPRFEHLPDRLARRAAVDDWYQRVYFPWKRRVVEAISAHPDAARAAFNAAHPHAAAIEAYRAHLAGLHRRQAQAQARRERGQDAFAAMLAADGTSVKRIAERFGWRSWQTARKRIEAGRHLWAEDPVAARELLIETYRPVSGAVDVAALVDRLAVPLLADLERRSERA